MQRQRRVLHRKLVGFQSESGGPHTRRFHGRQRWRRLATFGSAGGAGSSSQSGCKGLMDGVAASCKAEARTRKSEFGQKPKRTAIGCRRPIWQAVCRTGVVWCTNCSVISSGSRTFAILWTPSVADAGSLIRTCLPCICSVPCAHSRTFSLTIEGSATHQATVCDYDWKQVLCKYGMWMVCGSMPIHTSETRKCQINNFKGNSYSPFEIRICWEKVSTSSSASVAVRQFPGHHGHRAAPATPVEPRLKPVAQWAGSQHELAFTSLKAITNRIQNCALAF